MTSSVRRVDRHLDLAEQWFGDGKGGGGGVVTQWRRKKKKRKEKPKVSRPFRFDSNWFGLIQ
ncbi:hypothetical protein JCGZ_24403 [Jatropha curcas]|uniref:Uncharacterized protein n=1 Tax=Jatropha curcas TaxID=180498 RepID=A0A067LEW2_JATCU|nr:hypothetical protein JCGZ_24403 [Jatropha curcas]